MPHYQSVWRVPFHSVKWPNYIYIYQLNSTQHHVKTGTMVSVTVDRPVQLDLAIYIARQAPRVNDDRLTVYRHWASYRDPVDMNSITTSSID